MNEGLRTSETRDFDNHPSASSNTAESGSMLEQRARQIGTVVGTAVVVARQAQNKLKNVKRDVKKSASNLADEYPIEVVLAAGVIGLFIGAALRLGRSSHGA